MDKSLSLPIMEEGKPNYSNLINAFERLLYIIKTNGSMKVLPLIFSIGF